ncbi:hypothetical protein ZORO111903_07285 [Zobellia roscoffensis]
MWLTLDTNETRGAYFVSQKKLSELKLIFLLWAIDLT